MRERGLNEAQTRSEIYTGERADVPEEEKKEKDGSAEICWTSETKNGNMGVAVWIGERST